MDPDMGPFIWVETYSDPVGLERAFEPSFDQVEKKPYDTLAEWMEALRVGTEKVPETERSKQTLRRSDLLTAKESRQVEDKTEEYEMLTYVRRRAQHGLA